MQGECKPCGSKSSKPRVLEPQSLALFPSLCTPLVSREVFGEKEEARRPPCRVSQPLLTCTRYYENQRLCVNSTERHALCGCSNMDNSIVCREIQMNKKNRLALVLAVAVMGFCTMAGSTTARTDLAGPTRAKASKPGRQFPIAVLKEGPGPMCPLSGCSYR